MSLFNRLRNVFRPSVTDDIDEELKLHIEEAVANGRDPAEARRSLGSPLRLREESHDARIVAWLDALRADAVFGSRQLRKNGVTSAAGILSLALAIGACTAAFRVADALLWRPLPIAHPERLHVLALTGTTPDGKVGRSYSWAYPQFVLMRDAVKDQAQLIAASQILPAQITYGSDDDAEATSVQYVSGTMLGTFGLRPIAGRLLSPSDDVTAGGHPYAVLSADYWARRFGSDPHVIGRSFRTGKDTCTIIGVLDGAFAGTEPGNPADIFLPTAMHPGFTRDDSTWMRILAVVTPGAAINPIRDQARAIWRGYETERAKKFTDMPQSAIDQLLNLGFELTPAPSGSSRLSTSFAMPLAALGAMVVLVLLIACGNLANLMSAQAAWRGREMALRASIGAGRHRLIQLVIVESAMVAIVAASIGSAFAAWAAPFVVSQTNPPDNPARLWLPYDWRVTAFSVALALGVTALFGIWPALKVSAISPLNAMRGASTRHTRRPVARTLIAAQVAFCVFVLFVAGLSTTTFARLANRPLGFSPDGVFAVSATSTQATPGSTWEQLRADLQQRIPGSTVALAGWPLLQGSSWNGFVSFEGAPATSTLGEFLDVSPELLGVMKIPLVAGRRFNLNDRAPGQAIVNETFLRSFAAGASPTAAIGRHFSKGNEHYEIVGVMSDAVYKNTHEEIPALAFVPFAQAPSARSPWQLRSTTLIVGASQSSQNWRQLVRELAPGIRVTAIRTQQAIIDAQNVRERLLAMLGLFFAGVALALTGVGLYGMLHYSVLQRQREIGIRRAIGASAFDVATAFGLDLALTLTGGVIVGLIAGYLAARSLDALFYGVHPSDASALLLPALLVVTTALAAGTAPIIRAVKISPVSILRAD